MTSQRDGISAVRRQAGEARDFLFPKTSRLAVCPTQPPTERPGREADVSASHCAEVKYVWSSTSTLPMSMHGMCNENVTFTVEHDNKL